MVRHPHVGREAVQVEQLPHPPRRQLDEAAELVEVLQGHELPKVALHIRGEVVRQGHHGVQGIGMDAWVASGKYQLIHRQAQARREQLVQRQRQQLQLGRHALDLVKHGSLPELRQEAARIAERELAGVGPLQVGVGQVREGPPADFA